MDYWAGKIELPSGDYIEGVELSTPRPASLSIPDSPLRFLAVVDVSRIPLYLAVGPSLDVYSRSEQAKEWFITLLLRNPSDPFANAAQHLQWWKDRKNQSPFGVLAQVQNDGYQRVGPRITEVLFYGTVSWLLPDGTSLSPGPPSSDPYGSGANEVESFETPRFNVHALALSSDLLRQVPAVTTPPLSPGLLDAAGIPPKPDAEDAQFLPPLFDVSEPFDLNSRKRQSVSSLFDEAAERRKKARRKGGESISAAASRANGPVLSLQHRRSTSLGNIDPFDPQSHGFDAQSRPGSSAAVAVQSAGRGARPLSRSPSLSMETRPLSRKGLLDGTGKRSSLSRVTSVANADEESMESRNKDTVSRLVMAGMRMYGLQQRKKSTRMRKESVSNAAGVPLPGEEQHAEEAAKDEEYKLVYHQTYKGAVFAMRNHISTEPLTLHMDQLRETVDKLLAIFCTDPLSVHVESPSASVTPVDRKAPFGADTTPYQKSPFDERNRRFDAGSLGRIHTPDTRRNAGRGG